MDLSDQIRLKFLNSQQNVARGEGKNITTTYFISPVAPAAKGDLGLTQSDDLHSKQAESKQRTQRATQISRNASKESTAIPRVTTKV